MVDRRSRARLTAGDRARLIDFYKVAMFDLSQSLANNALLDSQRPRFAALLSETNLIMDRLDAEVARWTRQEIQALYRGNLKWTDRQLKVRGVPLKRAASAAAYSQIHDQVIDEIINNPTTGLGPRLTAISGEMRKSVQEYVKQHKTLLGQVRTINAEIANGVLTGRAATETRDAVMSAIQNTAPRSMLGLPRANSSRPYATFLESPYLKIATSRGVRNLHIFDHVNMIAVTKESEVRTQARNNRLLERGIELVQITPNPPLTPDACALYAGRVFALTEEAAILTGFPLLARLPNGGPPFHPFCTHSTLPWVPEFVDEDEVEEVDRNGDRGTRAVRGVPAGALDRNFSDAQKFFRKKGGIEYAARQNPVLKRGPVSRFADDRVRAAFPDQ